MHQKWSKVDRISVMNNLVYQFYESDHVLDFFTTYIAFTTVQLAYWLFYSYQMLKCSIASFFGPNSHSKNKMHLVSMQQVSNFSSVPEFDPFLALFETICFYEMNEVILAFQGVLQRFYFLLCFLLHYPVITFPWVS